MELRLAQDVPFDVLTEALRTKFREASRFFRGAKMAVSFTGRVLNRTEEKAILEIISDEAGIDVVCIIDRDENNEMMYRSVVEQTLFNMKKREGQFYRGTLARREVLESDASIVILGDVEPKYRHRRGALRFCPCRGFRRHGCFYRCTVHAAQTAAHRRCGGKTSDHLSGEPEHTGAEDRDS